MKVPRAVGLVFLRCPGAHMTPCSSITVVAKMGRCSGIEMSLVLHTRRAAWEKLAEKGKVLGQSHTVSRPPQLGTRSLLFARMLFSKEQPMIWA